MFLRLILFALAICSMSCSAWAAPLSDSAARKVIEDFYNASKAGVFVGTFLVEERGFDPSNGRITFYSYHFIKAAESLGWVSVRSLPKATGPLGVPLTPPHVFSERIVVALTDKGREINVNKQPAGSSAPYDTLLIPQGMFTVQKVIRNEEMRREADDYRLVLVTYSAEWNENFLELMGRVQKAKNVFEGKCAGCVGGPRHGTKRKARILLKYDDFKSTWSIVTSDGTNEDEAFSTDNVNKFLSTK